MIQSSLKKVYSPLGIGWSTFPNTREAWLWLILARLGVLYLILSVLVVQQVIGKVSPSVAQLSLAFGLLGIAFCFNFFQAIFVNRIPTSGWVVGVHIVFDALLISTWVYFASTKVSFYALLYLIQILLVSLICYQRAAIFASVVACLFYGGVIFSLSSTVSAGFFTWASYSVLFLMLGLIGGYLSEELQRTNQKLHEKQEKIDRLTILHEHIISNVPTGILSLDEQMNINYLNFAGEKILGVSSNDVTGRPLSEVQSGLLPFFTQIQTEKVEEEEPSAIDNETEVSSTGDQHHRSFFVSSKTDKGSTRLQQLVEIEREREKILLRGDVADLAVGFEWEKARAGKGRVLLFQDVTKLLHMEDNLKQHEKLAAVGQLAAGIAHEIRNPLASMSASIEMLKSSIPVQAIQAEDHKLMDIAIREIDRLNQLISEFLNYVKPIKGSLGKVDLRGLLAEVVTQARSLKEVGAQIEIKERYETQMCAHANQSRIKQVVWNLIINSIQATPNGGVIEVGCSEDGPYKVKFWVRDEGMGMTEEVQAHLFEPFFTTKEKGTGLGLATVYRIVEAHRGEIHVESKVGQGTRFEVTLQSEG